MWPLWRHILAPRLPMRNWNQLQPWSISDRTDRSQTTYEELKLGEDFAWLTGLLTGSQTTYEELKLSHLKEKIGGFRSQTTYEELKLEKLAKFYIPQEHAPRLPMRNWNFQRTKRGMYFFQLPDYLWGIETVLLLQGFTAVLAPRLPMRNWNIG